MTTGWLMTGTQAEEEVLRINEQRDDESRSRKHQRFFLKPGEECEIIILDRTPADTVALHEHCIPIGGSWKNCVYESSPKSIGQEDPLEVNNVLGDKPSKAYFVKYYTILAIQPYTKDVNGVKQTIPYFRKLLPIKSSLIKDFNGLEEAAMNEYGTIRGMRLRLKRSPKDANAIGETAIGKPIIHSGVSLMAHYTEAELLKLYGHPPILYNGKLMTPENGLLQPFDYLGEVFKKPDADDLRRRYKIGAEFGSKQEIDSVWNTVAENDLQTPVDSPAPSTPVQSTDELSTSATVHKFDDVQFED